MAAEDYVYEDAAAPWIRLPSRIDWRRSTDVNSISCCFAVSSRGKLGARRAYTVFDTLPHDLCTFFLYEDKSLYQQTRHYFQCLVRPQTVLMLAVALGAAATRPLPSHAGGLKEMNRVAEPKGERPIAIVGGRLFDSPSGRVVERATIVVREAQIEAAGPSETVTVPDDASVIDAMGMTVLPGLVDSHLHTVNDLEMPALVLRHGVTAFRDPGHPLRFYQALLQTEQMMPRAFLTGSHLDAYPPIWPQQAAIVNDAEHARQWVNQHVDHGASGIKIYFRLPLDFFSSVCETAQQRGVPVTAHLELVDADDAIRAGVDGIEHVTSFGTVLAEAAAADAFRTAVAATPAAREDLRYRLWADLNLDPQLNPRILPLLNLIVANGVFVSPTLAVFERRPGDEDTAEYHTVGFAKMLRFVGMCHRAGARVVVGSHTWVPHAQRGWAYQREMELLVEAGLSPADACVVARGITRSSSAQKIAWEAFRQARWQTCCSFGASPTAT